MSLGRRWYHRFGVPYILDFQDPWVSEYYCGPSAPKPPGGRFKYGLTQGIAKILEPYALTDVKHIISVSPVYVRTLIGRYPWLREDQFSVLPFGAPEKDFDYLQSLGQKQRVFDPSDGNYHWVYLGRGGGDMALALRILFLAIRNSRKQEPMKWKQIKLHFVGTDYAPGEQKTKTVEPIAEELGIGDLVDERPERIPYFESLQTLIDSDAILLTGSDDPGYTASKLYPCVLSRKAILAVFHEQSSVVQTLRRCNAGRAVTFKSNEEPTNLVKEMSSQLDWLLSRPKGYQPETNWSEFKPFTAFEMTRRQCSIFDRCLS
ncbi:MAG: hypothetical protein ACRD8W_28215 [Nitrososphaeraceae archaeon]